MHIMTLGMSQDHVFPIIARYRPIHITFLSSETLHDQTMDLARLLERDHGIRVDIVNLDPFRVNALAEMISTISETFQGLNTMYQHANMDLYMGITGGTNLMVIAAAMVALRYRLKMHYVLNPEYAQGRADIPPFGVMEIDSSIGTFLWRE